MTQWLRDVGLVSVSVVLFVGVLLARVLYVSPYLGGLLGSPERDTVMVVVAARDLSPGVFIREGDLYALAMRPEHIPDGAFLAPAHVVGRVPHEKILKNELVRGGRLYQPGLDGGLGAVIPRDTRAISLWMPAEAAVMGAIKPGDYVDVLATIVGDGSIETQRLPISFFVLDVRPDGLFVSVRLLTTTSGAEQITHLANRGEIALALVNDVDGCLGSLKPDAWMDWGTASQLSPSSTVQRWGPVQPKKCREFQLLSGGQKKSISVDESGVPCL